MKIKFALLFMLAALSLAACGGAASSPAPAASTTAPASSAPAASAGPSPAAAPGTVNLRLWGHQNNSFNQANQKMLDAFMAQNPTIKVTYETFPFDVFIQTIQTSLPAGTTADLIELPSTYVCRYAQGGQLAAVPEAVMSYSQAKEMFYAAPLEALHCGGVLYGFPSEYNLEYGGAYVNADLFAKHSVAYPPKWAEWSAMVADAAKLAEVENGAMTRAGMHYTNSDQLFTYFLSGILQQGGNYFAADGRSFNFDTPEARTTIKALVDMVATNKVVDPVLFNADSNWVGESFAQGNAAIAVLGSWYGGEAKLTHPELRFDYVTLPPMFGSQHKFITAGGWSIVVGAKSPNQEAAWKLAAFMSANKDNALAFNSTTGTIPALKAIAEQPKELLAKAPFLEATLPLLPFGQYHGDLTDAGQLQFEIVYPAILDALQGLITADEAAARIHEEANAMVDSNKK